MPFQILPEFTPGAPGGVCFICKSARRQTDRVIDCFVDPDELGWVTPTALSGMAFELAAGNLEVCETCITEAGRMLGMETADKVEKAQKVAKDAIAKSVRLEAELKDALEALEYRRKVQTVADRVFGEESA